MRRGVLTLALQNYNEFACDLKSEGSKALACSVSNWSNWSKSNMQASKRGVWRIGRVS